MNLWNGFEEKAAPLTGRRTVQLTAGNSICYPLYYFIPCFSRDGTRLVYHRVADGRVQLHALDLTSGTSIQLTHAQSRDSQWIPWCVDSGGGVLDHRSVFDVEGERVIYFDGREACCVGLDAKNDRCLFTLPGDRIAIGQNCLSPDGRWFVYIHHDRELFASVYPGGREGRAKANRSLSIGTVLAAYNLETGEHRTLVVINSPIHHVLPYDDDTFVFCHPATENGMLLTDLNGGWYAHLRTQDDRGGQVCHYVATRAGIAYEVLGRKDGVWSGLYDPFSHERFEFRLPSEFGYTHTGRDPEGLLWFYESHRYPAGFPSSGGDVHDLHFLARHSPDGKDEWSQLTGNWPTYGGGQKSHFHPQVCPDRKWILMTGGDPATETNHLFLVDISDLKETRGIPPVRRPKPDEPDASAGR